MYNNEIGQFNLIKNSIDFSILDKEYDEETKKFLLAFMFCEHLKGMKIYIPTKTHKMEMAKKMIIEGEKNANIQKKLELDRRTICKLKRNINDWRII